MLYINPGVNHLTQFNIYNGLEISISWYYMPVILIQIGEMGLWRECGCLTFIFSFRLASMLLNMS